MAEIGDACDGPCRRDGRRDRHALRSARRGASGPAVAGAARPARRLLRPPLIASDPAGRFTLLSIVWGPGQFSPPHAHDTWCAYAVAENTLTETLYAFDAASGKAVAARYGAA